MNRYLLVMACNSFYKLLNSLQFLHVQVCVSISMCMFVCYPQRPEEGAISTGARITVALWLWQQNPGPLEAQHALLAAEFLSSPILPFYLLLSSKDFESTFTKGICLQWFFLFCTLLIWFRYQNNIAFIRLIKKQYLISVSWKTYTEYLIHL